MLAPAADRVIDLAPESPRPVAVHRVKTAAAWVGGWTAFVVFMSAVIAAARRIPFQYALASSAMNYYALGVVSLVVWRAHAVIAARAWSASRRIGAHLALAALLLAAWQLAYGGYMRLLVGPSVWTRVYGGSWLFQLVYAVSLYGGVVAVTAAIQASQRARAAERREYQLALLARDAELRALTARLEPHFLLNTLNSVLALIDRTPSDARVMIERLAELLRAAFDEGPERTVTLGREMDLVAAYLGIEQVRFADRLQVRIDVPESLKNLQVPPFLLQPLVENAIKHGVAPFTCPGLIAVRARRAGDRVLIEVADSGPGFDREQASMGQGLSIAERRLRAFAPSGELAIGRDADGRFAVTLSVPA